MSQQRTRRTGLVWHERYMWHDTGSAFGPINTGVRPFAGARQPGVHSENAETKRRLKNQLDALGITETLVPIRPFAASDAQLLRFHTQAHLDRVAAASRSFGADVGDAAPAGPGSDEIARLAVGGAIAALEAVVTGAVDNAYVLSRPPGHHAEPDMGMGFCIYGNVALAIMDLIDRGLVGRVAVVDWDVHHGNGTETAFYDRDDVLTISLHQDRLYPLDRGGLDACGAGAGAGFNVNVPLPPGSGGGAWLGAMDRLVLPALLAFRPELIVVACGFDGCFFDPLAHQMLLSSHYRAMTERVLSAADALCGGRLAVVHEGGYSDFYVPFCGVAVIDVLRGEEADLLDPFLESESTVWQALQPHQEALIEAAVAGPLKRLRARSS
ncbi:MAG: class II histone deacetylase [Pseudomonadales bacterium]|jgi:acetoin utilization deacetylase AcuC-like enzyme|nr:class II histone deacetylase [Pseudomonadales bacterium]